MNSFLDKHNLEEAIFNRLFGKEKGQESTQKSKDGFITILPDDTYLFGKNHVVKTNYNKDEILAFDWRYKKLNWLFNSTFEAQYIQFDLKDEKIDVFQGDFSKGSFTGDIFYGVFSGDAFYGKVFSSGIFEDYKSSPMTFFGEKIGGESSGGILGIADEKPSVDKGEINFMAIPKTYVIEIISNRGIKSSIKVDKRLDINGPEFIYEVFDGYKAGGVSEKKTILWGQLRNIYNTNKVQLNLTSTKNIGDILNIPDGVSKWQIVEKEIAAIKPQPAAVAGTNTFDFITIGLNKVPSSDASKPQKRKFEVYLPDASYAEAFNQVLTSYPSKFAFDGDLFRIKEAIENNVVTGYGDFKYLSPIFKNYQGNDVSKVIYPSYRKGQYTSKYLEEEENPTIAAPKEYEPIKSNPYGNDKQLYSAMKRMENFVRFVVNRIVLPGTTSPDTKAKESILNYIKKKLNIDEFFEGQVGKTATAPSKAGEKITKFKLKEHEELAKKIFGDLREVF